MNKHEIKHCLRCKVKFDCQSGNIAECQCTKVSISEEVNAFLTKTAYDCLCKNCLAQLEIMMAKSKLHSFPEEGEELIENLHYYRENGLYVFTEFYHLLRGHCCKDSCRHCAYGYRKGVK